MIQLLHSVALATLLAVAAGAAATNAPPDWVWAISVSGAGASEGRALAADRSDNVYFVGNFSGTAAFGTTNLIAEGRVDLFLAKVDASGQVLWVVQARSTEYAFPSSLALDSTGNVYLAGEFYGILDCGTTNLNSGYFTWRDAFLLKYDSDGRCQWAWQGNSGDSSLTYCSAVVVDSNDDAIFSGHYRPFIDFGNDAGLHDFDNAFVAKFNGAGQIQSYQDVGGAAPGEWSWHDANALAVDEARNIYVTGYFSHQAGFGRTGDSFHTNLVSGGVSDIYVAKYNSALELQWVRQAGCPSDGNDEDDSYDTGLGIAVDRIGNVYVTGSFSAPDARFGATNLTATDVRCFFLAKYDPVGALQWVRNSPDNSRRGNSVIVDGSGDVYATSLSLSFVHQYDGAGNLIWTQGAGAASEPLACAMTIGPDRSKYVTGSFSSRLILGSFAFTNSGTHAFLAKLDAAGTGPRLNIVMSSTNVVLSWPLAAVGYTVETSETLTGSADWDSLAGSPGTNSIYRTLTVPRRSANGFYRLRRTD
jgi:hypothetical protein